MTQKDFEKLLSVLIQSIPEDVGATMPTIYNEWKPGVHYGGKGEESIVRLPVIGTFSRPMLFKCITPHTSQEDWSPDKTPALWTYIDLTHAGTLDDPIPAQRSMEYVYGKYYLDPEDEKIYLCKRTGEPEGGTITLHYLPHELIGHYFEEVV